MQCPPQRPGAAFFTTTVKGLDMAWIDDVSLVMLVLLALTLGLAPFVPEPHLFEKLRMLMQGTLVRPIDIFDLLMHGAPWVVLLLKLGRMTFLKLS